MQQQKKFFKQMKYTLQSKITLLSILFLLSMGISHAQSFRGGMFAGFTASQIDGDKLDGYNRPNLKIGLLTELKKRRRKPATFGFELLYQGKGSSTWINKGGQGPDRKIRLHYIELLPYYKYFLTKKTSVRGGVAFGYLLSADKLIEGEQADFQDGYFNSVTFEGNIGIQTQLTSNLFFNIDFQYSLAPIADVSTEDILLYKGGMHNNIVGFTLYTFFN